MSLVKGFDLAKYVLDIDFVFLTETFTESVPEDMFPNHDIYVAPGIKLSESVFGRLCGGVASNAGESPLRRSCIRDLHANRCGWLSPICGDRQTGRREIRGQAATTNRDPKNCSPGSSSWQTSHLQDSRSQQWPLGSERGCCSR